MPFGSFGSGPAPSAGTNNVFGSAMPATAAAAGEHTGLTDIANSLDKINGLMDEAKRKLTDHLLNEEKSSPASAAPAVDISAIQALITPLSSRLDALSTLVSENKSGASGAGAAPSAGVDISGVTQGVQAMFDGQNGMLQMAFGALDKKIEDAVNYIVANVKAPAPAAAPVVAAPAHQPAPVAAPIILETPKPQPAPQANPFVQTPAPAKTSDGISKAQLLKMILGAELCSNSSLGVYRDELLDGFLRGDKASAGLIGVMIEFQASTPERMPRLLQDIGEAYYRWHPKRTQGSNPFERALAEYVCKACDSYGIKNSIEIVETGQRFDAGRHNSVNRGVEIIEVKGWVVLRDNGKVYTRAAVDVQ